MKFILKLGLILMVYTLIAGVSLGFINKVTKPKIEEQQRMERERAQKEVLPEALVFVEDTTSGGLDYLIGYDSEGRTSPVGYILTTFGDGFSSKIKTIFSVTTDFKVGAIEIVYQEETPGLGTRCVEIKGDSPEPWFEMQFDSRSPQDLLVDKDGGNITSITGATITSRAIANSVQEKLEEFKNELGASKEDSILITSEVRDSIEIGGDNEPD
ncbi:RnfABCDGE type electron transport complex subunit G [bacterium]|nr:RnfABCDGE type electron transport complex subunit G [bacterium]